MEQSHNSGRSAFNRFSLAITSFNYCVSLLPQFIRSLLWDMSRPFGGKFALLIRYAILKSRSIKVGQAVYIGRNVTLLNCQNLSLGDNVSIHENCYIDAIGQCLIGNNVSIAHGSSILTFDHGWSDPELPIKYNPIALAPVTLSNDVWIGCGVRILRGTHIGSRSVVAAGSVVRSDVPEFSIYGGIPAKKIGSTA